MWTDREGADFPIAEFLMRTKFESSLPTEIKKQFFIRNNVWTTFSFGQSRIL